MEISRKKISKLLKGNNQTNKKYKKHKGRKKRKQGRSFRKKKPLNLRRRSLARKKTGARIKGGAPIGGIAASIANNTKPFTPERETELRRMQEEELASIKKANDKPDDAEAAKASTAAPAAPAPAAAKADTAATETVVKKPFHTSVTGGLSKDNQQTYIIKVAVPKGAASIIGGPGGFSPEELITQINEDASTADADTAGTDTADAGTDTAGTDTADAGTDTADAGTDTADADKKTLEDAKAAAETAEAAAKAAKKSLEDERKNNNENDEKIKILEIELENANNKAISAKDLLNKIMLSVDKNLKISKELNTAIEDQQKELENKDTDEQTSMPAVVTPLPDTEDLSVVGGSRKSKRRRSRKTLKKRKKRKSSKTLKLR